MSDVVISYKGESLAEMNASGAKTLLTSGKYLEDDISVAYTKQSGGGSKVAHANAQDAWYITFSVPNIGDWKALALERVGAESTDSGTRKQIADKTLGLTCGTYVNNSGASSGTYANGQFVDTQPSAMSQLATFWTKANEITITRLVGNANYIVGQAYKLTLYYE